MAKKEKQQKEKAKQYGYYGFNVKILTNAKKTEKLYLDAFANIYEQGITAVIAAEKGVSLRTQFSTKVPFKDKDHVVLYGKIVRYTLLEKGNWYSKQIRDYVEHEVPKDIFPNPFEADYVFIPAVHRFFIRTGTKVSITAAEAFLKIAVKKVIGGDEDVDVYLIKSTELIEKIINSKEIKSVKVTLSYTNNDIGGDAEDEMDEVFKDLQLGKGTFILSHDVSGHLNKENTFLKGIIGLSKDNGEAEASIINDEGKREKVITKAHADKIKVVAKEEDAAKNELFQKMMKEHKNDN